MSYFSKSQKTDNNNIIWPGFVDVLASTLMVIIFIVLLFTVSQVYLGDLVVGKNEKILSLEETINIQDETIEEQDQSLTDKESTLIERQSLILNLDEQINKLDIEINEKQTQISSKNQQIEFQDDVILEQDELLKRKNEAISGLDEIIQKQELDIEGLNKIIAKITEELSISMTERNMLEGKLTKLVSEQQILKNNMDELGIQNQELVGQINNSQNKILTLLDSLSSSQTLNEDLSNKISQTQIENNILNDTIFKLEEDSLQKSTNLDEALDLISRLALDIEILGNEINLLNNLLESKEAEIAQNNLELGELGDRLNRVLTSEIFKLQKYKSEFFGKLSNTLSDRDDVQIKGDRFIFQSEILFDSGSATIQSDGKEALSIIARSLLEIAQEIPSDLNWIIQIDGHTDKIPISTSKFPSNWELSHSRALEVLKFFIAQGIPEGKLSANGYGEFQPINLGNSSEDLRENRRIELKITQN